MFRKCIKRDETKIPIIDSQPGVSAILIISSLFINLLGLAFPMFLLQIYDRIIPSEAFSTLLLLVLGVSGALFLEAALKIGRGIVNAWSDARFEHKLSTTSFKKIINAKIDVLQVNGSGAYLEKLNSLHALKDFYGSQAITAKLDVPFVLIFLGLLGYIGGALVFIPAFMLGISLIGAYYYGKLIQDVMNDRRRVDDQRMNFLIEILSGIHTIKAYAMEKLMLRRYERLQKGSAKWDHKLILLNSQNSSYSNFISQTMLVALVSVGSLRVIDGALTVGGLAACTMLASRAMQPFSRIMMFWKRMQSVEMAKMRLMEIFELPNSNDDSITDDENAPSTGDVALQNIDFNYDGLKHILKKANLYIKENTCISICNQGDSGKTTLFLLMMGLLDPTSGDICIGGDSLKNISRSNICDRIGYIPQHGTLYNGTIIDNLSLFNDDNIEQARCAAKLINIEKEILKLPQGYQTVVGGRIVDAIPPGMKQMICIARELISLPDIIIFDEADTHLDDNAKASVIKILNILKEHHTVIISSTDRDIDSIADVAYIIEDGQFKLIRHDCQIEKGIAG